MNVGLKRDPVHTTVNEKNVVRGQLNQGGGNDSPVVVKPGGITGYDDVVSLLCCTLLAFQPTAKLPTRLILILNTHRNDQQVL